MINLLENEKVILIRRRHWFIIFVEGLFILLMGVLPFVGLLFIPYVISDAKDILIEYSLFIIFYGTAWLLLFWMFFFITWTNYYLDVFLVTNKRIIDIEQFGLFARDLAEVRLENIQDIKVEIIGFIPSLLKMGGLHIQTAGQSKEVFFSNMPDPDQVKHVISEYHEKLLKEQQSSFVKRDAPPDYQSTTSIK